VTSPRGCIGGLQGGQGFIDVCGLAVDISRGLAIAGGIADMGEGENVFAIRDAAEGVLARSVGGWPLFVVAESAFF